MMRRDPERDLRPSFGPAGSPASTTLSSDVQELSLRELVNRLSTDVPLLVRQEAELAKVEIDQRLQQAKKDAVKAVAGGAVAYAGALALVCAVIAVLSYAMAVWVSALVVGALLCIVGVLLLQKGGKDLAEVRHAVDRPAANIRTDFRVFKEAAQ